jgi:CBS domain-containing protein
MTDPSILVASEIHRITTVHAGARRSHRNLADCPRSHEATDTAVCASCAHAEGFVGGIGTRSAHVLCIVERPQQVYAEPGTVAGLMRKDVVCVRADVAIDDIAFLFMERSIGGVPVVDANDRPIGMISKTDLVATYARYGYFHGNLLDSFDADASACRTPVLAGDIMSAAVIVLREQESLARAAELFAAQRMHRAPVVASDGRLIGVLTSFDLVRSIAGDASSRAA